MRARFLTKATALVVRPEELRGAGGGHRGRRGDLQRERRRGDDLREAVDLAGAGTAEQLEPAARERERGAAADGRHLEPGEAERDLQAVLDPSFGAVAHRAGAYHPEVLARGGEDRGDRSRRSEGDRLHSRGDRAVRAGP